MLLDVTPQTSVFVAGLELTLHSSYTDWIALCPAESRLLERLDDVECDSAPRRRSDRDGRGRFHSVRNATIGSTLDT